MVAYSGHSWSRSWVRSPHYLVSCSRDVLDWHLRKLVLENSRVRLLDGAEAVALVGDARRVTGVRVKTREGGERHLDTTLVIDASGRGSCSLDWLTSLGITGIHEHVVDDGIVHASRIYQAKRHQGAFPS
ncbi:hypothetical protein ACWGQ5_16335 [Streptomyces sp. NPDC055722]